MSFPLPQIEGKYEILHKIKDGGMGAVYKVRHLLLDEVRVVKTIRPEIAEDPGLQERFLREAKTVIRLRHPNIAQLYDFAVGADGTAYIVMEYIEGVTLQELLAKGGTPPVSLTLEIAHQSLQALAYLHEKGFAHRDVAPDNLMLTRGFDGSPRVKLIDLGIVKRLEDGGADLTAAGTFLGKARYAAPEQFSSTPASLVGPLSDIYSFGVMLYELLTGRLPYRGSGVNELIAGHLFREPIGFDESDPQGRVSAPLREIVLQAMAKEPKTRIAGAGELATLLTPLRAESATLQHDLDETLRSTALLVEEAPAPVTEPGSTQRALDRQFGIEATPPPEPSRPPPPAAGPRRIETRQEETAAIPGPDDDTVPIRAQRWDEAAVEPPGPVGEARRPLPGWVWGAAAGLVLLLAGGLVWYLAASGEPAPPVAPEAQGYLVLDALPWAEVTEIRDADGRVVPLEGPRHTPLRLALPPGAYAVSLASPGAPGPVEVTAEIHAGETTERRERIGEVDVDAYFERVGLQSPAPAK